MKKEQTSSALSITEAKLDESIPKEFELPRTMKMKWLGDIKYQALFELWISIKEPIKDQEDDSNEAIEFIVNDADE